MVSENGLTPAVHVRNANNGGLLHGKNLSIEVRVRKKVVDEDCWTESRIHEKKERRYRIDWLRGAPHGHVSLVPYPDRMICSWFAEELAL